VRTILLLRGVLRIDGGATLRFCTPYALILYSGKHHKRPLLQQSLAQEDRSPRCRACRVWWPRAVALVFQLSADRVDPLHRGDVRENVPLPLWETASSLSQAMSLAVAPGALPIALPTTALPSASSQGRTCEVTADDLAVGGQRLPAVRGTPRRACRRRPPCIHRSAGPRRARSGTTVEAGCCDRLGQRCFPLRTRRTREAEQSEKGERDLFRKSCIRCLCLSFEGANGSRPAGVAVGSP